MSLEQALADNTAAVKELTAALKAGGTTKAGKGEAKAETKAETKQEEKKPEPPKGPSIDEVRAALKAYAAIEGKPAAIEKLKAIGGVDTIQDLAKEKYQAVIDGLKD